MATSLKLLPMAKKDQLLNIRKNLVNHALAIGCKPNEAEDVVDEVMLKVLSGKVNSITLPYLKTMVRNQWIDWKRGCSKLVEEPDFEALAECLADKSETDPRIERVRSFLERHPYGYIVLEMERRDLKRLKDLAPYTNEKADKLYKRYQKLLKDLEAYERVK